MRQLRKAALRAYHAGMQAAGTLVALLLLLALPGLYGGAAALTANVPDCPQCSAGHAYFVSIAGTGQISNGIVTTVTQDRRGLIWIGTPEGLMSFDGYQLRRYRHDPADPHSLGDDYVRALLAHSDGRLWVATQGGGLSIYDPLSNRFQRHVADGSAQALPRNAAISLAEGQAGEVWIGLSSAGLVRYDPDSGRFQSFRASAGDPTALRHDTVRSLLVDRRGDLWLGTGDGLQRRRHGQDLFERVASDPADRRSLNQQYVYSLFEASDGRIWIGTQSHGAAVYDPPSGSLRRYPAGPAGISHPWVSGFAEVAAGQIWVFTYGAGIDVIDADGGRVTRQIRSDTSIPGGLALDRLVAPFKDRSGLLWVGTWGAGLQVYNPLNAQTFVTYREQQQQWALHSANVFSTLAPVDDVVWIGSDQGLDEFSLRQGRLRGFRAAAGEEGALQDATVRALAQTAEDTLWVGTQHAGIQRFQPSTGMFSAPLVLPRGGTVRRLLVSRHGAGLWVGLQGGLVRLDPDSGSAQELGFSATQPLTDPVWSLAEDAAGNLWVGTPNDLLLLRQGEAWLQVVTTGLPQLRAVMDMQLDPQGVLWCSGPRGIARLQGWADGVPVFEDYGQRLGELPQGFGQMLLFDQQGRLWTPQAMVDTKSDRLFALGAADGIDIGSVAAGSASTLPDGRLLFGGTRGLLVVRPELYRPRAPQSAMLITELQIDGRPGWLGQPELGFELPAQAGRFTLSYAALDYAEAAGLRYAHRLVGLDRGWIEHDASRRLATYTNLWPGEYIFEIKSRPQQGEFNEPPLRVPVRVLAAWWQTRWALWSGILTVLLLAAWSIRLRTLRVRRRAQALELLVEQRTAELSSAKQRAEATLQELRGTQRQLVAAEKMASLGQLVAGVAHEINTPVGIALTAASHLQETSRHHAQLLEAGQLSRTALREWERDVEEGSTLILGSLRRATALVASFKQVSVDQSSDQRRSFRLAEFLEEVRLALHTSLRGTRIELQIVCAEHIEVDTYPGALFQVFTNLVNNAHIHAFAEGQAGQIRLEVAEQPEQRLLLRFSDNGRGMNQTEANRAFDPFFTTRRGSGGSGLGLHIVHNLITQLLGGSIELHTQPGAGAEFLIQLPCSAPQRNEV